MMRKLGSAAVGLAALTLALLCLFPPRSLVVSPPIVHAQNNGVVGVYTGSQNIFNNFSTGSVAISPTLNDIGQAANYLTFCNSSSFSGTIFLEWLPPASTTYIPLVTGTYVQDSSCHTLQVGGYYPNLRVHATRTQGAISAWYTASAAPISFFAAALGSNGSTSPVSCDNSAYVAVNNGATGLLAAETTGAQINICNFTISFAAAATTGNISIGWGSGSCTVPLTDWQIETTSSTPQIMNFNAPQNLRAPVGNALGTTQSACLVNNSGANLVITYNYATILSGL